MNSFTAPLNEYSEITHIRECLKEGRFPVKVTGCTDSQKCNLIAAVDSGTRLVVASDELKARAMFADYLLYDKNALFYPAKDIIFYNADVHGNAIIVERQKCIRKLLEGGNVTVFTSFGACMDKLVPPERIMDRVINIDRDTRIDLGELEGILTANGYTRTDETTQPGEFAIRGGIIDIFPVAEENPYRIEMWGDEIDIIKIFDPVSQRSIVNADSFSIYPAFEYVFDEDKIRNGLKNIEKEAEKQITYLRKEMRTEEAARLKRSIAEFKDNLEYMRSAVNLDSYVEYFDKDLVSFLDYFDKDGSVIYLDEPKRTLAGAEALSTEFDESMKNRLDKGYILPGQMKAVFDHRKLFGKLAGKRLIMLSTLEYRSADIKAATAISIDARNVSSYNGDHAMLVSELKNMKSKGYRVILLTSSASRAIRLASDLRDEGLTAVYSDDPDRTVQSGEVLVVSGSLSRGFEYPLIKFAVICETDIYGRQKREQKKKVHKQSAFDLGQLENGDFVVHETYGIGIYRGMEKIEVANVIKDYVKVEYAAGGTLHVPATAMDMLQKYSGPEGSRPKINKLDSPAWRNTTAKVRGAVKEIAADLVRLYAARQARAGFSYSHDTVWQKEFEEMFPFEETQDQLKAIDDTKKDMESPRIMDRLICGDVGFGKTEVAIRAAFKAIQDGKQVAMLAPTTVLVQQHYNTFVQRMSDFAVKIAQLSRFATPAQVRRTLSDMRSGRVDVVIGTHRLLSKDVAFKDLGLLIVDEEQRFGVSHKEKIKQLKEDVDVLTLTATPIPRTLHMSLIGIRDMSLLEEAPVDRLPIQTFVLEHNDELIREAVVRELARGGQVYYVYNRINRLDDIAAGLKKLIPTASVAAAHGQMDKHTLEDIMFDFINGDIDVLVSTTIIETGLDISNVNTIIIDEADKFGLAQLYQLRGRVGRSSRNAYAFLMYRRDSVLREVAEKRLEAIKNFTELGSGYRIAMRDLEIRGAGNLLGAEQSGHMASVGYDMYCKLLNEAVLEERSGRSDIAVWDTIIDIDVNAHIPDTYIKNEIQRLDMYKRISLIDSNEAMIDISEEMTDRYGEMPAAVRNLLNIALIKSRAHEVFITSLTQKGMKVSMKLFEKAGLDISRLPELMDRFKGRLRLVPGEQPYFDLSLEMPRGRVVRQLTSEDIFAQIKEALEAIKEIRIEQV